MLIRLAYRNLWRNPRRTGIVLLSVAGSLTCALFFTGIQNGSHAKMIDTTARSGSGHITLENRLYRNDPGLTHSIVDWRPYAALLQDIPGIDGWALRINGQGMLSSPHGGIGAAFDAIAPEQDNTSFIRNKIVRGHYLTTRTDSGIVIGSHLARQLKVEVGSKVVLTINDRHNNTQQERLHIAGIFDSGSPALDGFYFQIPLNTAQRIMGLTEHEVLQIAVFARTFRDASPIAREIRARMDTSDPVAVWTWDLIMADLAQFMAMDRAFNYILQIMLFVIVAFGILNTVFMSILERRFEFGLLLAIGFSPMRLFGLILMEINFMGLLGLFFGSLFGWALNGWFRLHPIDLREMFRGFNVSGFAMEPILRAGLFFDHYLVILVLVYLWILCVGLYPAIKTARLIPVEALSGR